MLKNLLMVLCTFTVLQGCYPGLVEVTNELNVTVISNLLDYCFANNYTVRKKTDLTKLLLCKYFTFIFLLIIIIMSPIITSDVMLDRIFLATEEGYCSIEVDSDNIASKILSILVVLVFVG